MFLLILKFSNKILVWIKETPKYFQKTEDRTNWFAIDASWFDVHFRGGKPGCQAARRQKAHAHTPSTTVIPHNTHFRAVLYTLPWFEKSRHDKRDVAVSLFSPVISSPSPFSRDPAYHIDLPGKIDTNVLSKKSHQKILNPVCERDVGSSGASGPSTHLYTLHQGQHFMPLYLFYVYQPFGLQPSFLSFFEMAKEL